MDTENIDNQLIEMSYPEARRFLLELEPTTPLPYGIDCTAGSAANAEDLARLARIRMTEGYVVRVESALRRGEQRVYIYFRRPGQR
jgi:hypothetical protein